MMSMAFSTRVVHYFCVGGLCIFDLVILLFGFFVDMMIPYFCLGSWFVVMVNLNVILPVLDAPEFFFFFFHIISCIWGLPKNAAISSLI